MLWWDHTSRYVALCHSVSLYAGLWCGTGTTPALRVFRMSQPLWRSKESVSVYAESMCVYMTVCWWHNYELLSTYGCYIALVYLNSNGLHTLVPYSTCVLSRQTPWDVLRQEEQERGREEGNQKGNTTTKKEWLIEYNVFLPSECSIFSVCEMTWSISQNLFRGRIRPSISLSLCLSYSPGSASISFIPPLSICMTLLK